MKLRTLPFGYTVRAGQVEAHAAEADAVRRIFEAYIHGASYKEIAEAFTTSGLRYHAETNVWNKNMVKRVLENRQYLGERYPALINSEVFSEVSRIQRERQNGMRASEPVRVILKAAVCGVCGAPMHRDTKNTTKGRWYCSSGDCPHVKKMHDTDLIERITHLLNLAMGSPSIVEYSEAKNRCVSLDVTRLQNEISREIEKTDFDEAGTTRLILELAAARYAACPDETTREKSLALRALFEQHNFYSDRFDTELFTEAVDAVLINPNGSVSLRLKNGQMVSNFAETEEGGISVCRQQQA